MHDRLVNLLMILVLSTSSLNAQNYPSLFEQKISATYMGQTPRMILENLAERVKMKIDFQGHAIKAKIQYYSFDEVSISEAFTKVLGDQDLFWAVQYGKIIIDDAPIDLTIARTITKENFDLSGKVVDKANGEALAYAAIGVTGTDIGTVTNADGFFTLLDIPNDTLLLTIQYVGYQTFRIPIKELIDQDPLVIQLAISEQILEEVVVEASNLDNQMINATEKISQISISPEALSSLPSMGEKDIFRSLQLLPGVSGTNEASSGLFVRGGTPDQNLILLDGFTVYHVDHFYGFFSAFNPNAIKNVQLYKGGFEPKFGGRLSSVMELTGKTGNQNRVSGGGGIGAISGNAYFEIPFGEKVNLFIAGRRSYTDIIESGVYNDIFDLYNDQSNSTVQTSTAPSQPNRRGNLQEDTEPAFFFYDLNAKLNYRPSERDVISFSFYNGQDDLDNSRVTSNSFENNDGETINIDNDIRDLLLWGNYGTSLRWARQWNDRYYSTAIASYSNY